MDPAQSWFVLITLIVILVVVPAVLFGRHLRNREYDRIQDDLGPEDDRL